MTSDGSGLQRTRFMGSKRVPLKNIPFLLVVLWLTALLSTSFATLTETESKAAQAKSGPISSVPSEKESASAPRSVSIIMV